MKKLHFLILSIFIFSIIFTNNIYAEEPASKDYVVFLHGIAKSSKDMQKMADFFQNNGYISLNIDYPSRKYPIEELADKVYQQIKLQTKDKNKKIHFVAHSMGGLITRAILNKYKIDNLGNVVMLGTPNQGSEVADFLQDNYFYKKFYGPAGQQLVTKQDEKLKAILGKPYYNLGIIAGDRSIDPVSSVILDGKDDGKVLIEKTKIEGMKDHIVIHATHTMMMKNKKVIQQAYNFIKNAKFKH